MICGKTLRKMKWNDNEAMLQFMREMKMPGVTNGIQFY
jgi:hypothetical protein